MKLRSSFAGVLLVSLVASPSNAVWFNTLDYFETEYPSACTASQVNNSGAWARIAFDGSSCLDDVYHFTKGGRSGHNVPNSQQDSGLWGTESFVVNDFNGFPAIKMMNERGVFCSPESSCIPLEIQDEHNPGSAYHRVFRDSADQEKGAFWMPVFVNGSYSATATFDLEYWWRSSDHKIMCVGNNQVYQEYSSLSQVRSVSGPYTLAAFLQDKRNVSLNKNVWHNVQAIKMTDGWGGNVLEEFWYGRWFDPVANDYRSLGLIQWKWIQNGQILNSNVNKYLVDCNVTTDCAGICPP